MVEAVVPIYISQKFGTYTSVGLFVAALEFFALFWALLLGPILDKLEKRRVITATLILYVPFSPLFLSLSTLLQFVFFRIYHSAIATALWLTSDAYLREHSSKNKESHAIGLFDFSVGAAQVIGGLIGAVIVVYLGFNIIYAVSFFAFVAMIVSFFIPDHSRKQNFASLIRKFHFSNVKKEFQDFFGNSEAGKLLFFHFPYVLSKAILPMIIPLFVSYISGSLSLACIVTALFYAPMMFESVFSTSSKPARTLTLACGTAIILYLVLFFTTNVAIMFVLVLLLGIAYAAISPLISGRFTQLMGKKNVGEMSAVIYAARGLAAAIGSVIAGIIADAFGLRYVFVIGFIVFTFLFLFRRKIFV